MTSARKRESNRANARVSTGPKTTEGKARAAQNARRHGLSLSVLADRILSREVETLAWEIAGEGAGPEVFEFARRVAEAQIDLARIRQTRHDFLVRNLTDPNYLRRICPSAADERLMLLDRLERLPNIPFVTELMEVHRPKGSKKLAAILSDISLEYAAIGRYERRALSRRKFAIRALDAVRRQAAE